MAIHHIGCGHHVPLQDGVVDLAMVGEIDRVVMRLIIDPRTARQQPRAAPVAPASQRRRPVRAQPRARRRWRQPRPPRPRLISIRPQTPRVGTGVSAAAPSSFSTVTCA